MGIRAVLRAVWHLCAGPLPLWRRCKFTPSKGAQAPLEPQRSPLPGTPITALASAFNCGFQVKRLELAPMRESGNPETVVSRRRSWISCYSRVGGNFAGMVNTGQLLALRYQF